MTVVTFLDADKQEHVVVLGANPFRPLWLARLQAERKLGRWAREGRAVYAEPLTFVNARR